ncbi:MAG: TolC family protein [Candidatus Hinthialibacter antarcticus]|nr:TolC family protein [Candidatus Hinthialibacter antarcticus]
MRPFLIVLTLVFIASGCVTTTPPNDSPATLTTSNSQYFNDETNNHSPMASITEPIGPLTLQQAASLALLHNPSLSAFSWEIRARESLEIQEGFYPNPELETELENFAGTGPIDLFNQAEATALYSQLIEFGGKRENRQVVAQWETESARWDYRVAVADVLAQVAQRYFDVLTAQQRIEILNELLQLAEESVFAISERVKTGRVAPMEETRARVELAAEQNLLDQAKGELEAAKIQLAAAWGSAVPQFELATGTLGDIHELPSLESLSTEVEANPDVQRWSAEMKKREAALNLEVSQAVPDITLSGGLRYINESDDVAFIAAVSFPLNIFNRNQGAIQASRERIQKGEEEKRAVTVEALSALSTVYQSLLSSRTQIDRLKKEILPGANSAYEAVREGYEQGKFAYLEVLDAQRTLFESRTKLIETTADFHAHWVALERLLGKPLQNVIPADQMTMPEVKNNE